MKPAVSKGHNYNGEIICFEGLWLTLNLESNEYMTNFADAYGIKLIIHEPGTFPFPSEEGITINPNYETTIGLRMVCITLLFL